jgi:hypothetical protein
MDGMQSVIMVRYVASIRLPGKVFHASQMPVVVKTPRGFKPVVIWLMRKDFLEIQHWFGRRGMPNRFYLWVRQTGRSW